MALIALACFPPDAIDEHMLLMWDCAPCHCSEATRARVKKDVPRCTLCFVPRGGTSVCQPCDRAYFKSVKAEVRKEWTSAVADEILASSNPIGQLLNKPALKGNLPTMVHSAVLKAHTPARRLAAWRPFIVNNAEELKEVVEEANEWHLRGDLFPAKDADPEPAADEMEDEAFEEAEAEEAAIMEPEDVEPEADEMEDEAFEEAKAEETPEAPAEPVAVVAAPPPPETKIALFRKLLGLRLAYGTANASDLKKAATLMKGVEGPSATAASSSSARPASSSTAPPA